MRSQRITDREPTRPIARMVRGHLRSYSLVYLFQPLPFNLPNLRAHSWSNSRDSIPHKPFISHTGAYHDEQTALK